MLGKCEERIRVDVNPGAADYPLPQMDALHESYDILIGMT